MPFFVLTLSSMVTSHLYAFEGIDIKSCITEGIVYVVNLYRHFWKDKHFEI